jgi:predicted thioesterase
MAETPIGASAAVALTVGEADLATSLRSGDVPVLATPRLVALCEEATVAAIEPHLEEGHTSVGARVEFDHLVPCGTGAAVEARAGIVAVDGRMVTFAVAVTWEGKTIARGTIIRAVVDRDRFLGHL